MNLSRILFDKQACSTDRGTFWHLLSCNPIILYLQGPIKPVIFVHKELRGKRAFLLRGPIGCEEDPKYARRWKNYFRKAQRFYPEHKTLFLCNTISSRETFQTKGLPSLFCSQNALLDENIYTIVRDVPKEFDAVYNAQMEKIKRHYLASQIKTLALITYRLESQPIYYKRMKKTLQHATLLNFESGEYKWLPDTQISYHLNRARVGLILSEAEGANYATVEYMLSGLPVVSTESSGGRSVFFDKEYVSVVDASPEAVADGVNEMISRNIDPEYIREKTLQKMQQHREVFIALLQQICNEEGIPRDMRAEWSDYFFNKLLYWHKVGELKDIVKTL
jgi:glycosyltransferase involved in cell wall biosynthesis